MTMEGGRVSAIDHFKIGVSLFKSDKFGEALARFHAARAAGDAPRDILLFMAASTLSLGQLSLATKFLLDHLAHEPNSIAGLNLLVSVYEKRNALDDAIDTLTRLFVINPSSVSVLEKLCCMGIKRERLSQALATFEKLVALVKPTEADQAIIANTMEQFARFLARLPHYDHTEQRLLKILLTCPACPQSLVEGLELAASSQHKLAAALFGQAAARAPNWSWVRAHATWHEHVHSSVEGRTAERFSSFESFCNIQTFGNRISAHDITISLLCPSRGRPAGLRTMIATSLASAERPERVEIIVYIDDDDLTADEAVSYVKEVASENISNGIVVIRGPRTGLARVWNLLGFKSSGFLLTLANDDQVYESVGWDRRLEAAAREFRDGIYCLWVNEGIVGETHGNFPFISRRLCDLLGYYFVPEILAFSNNDVWVWDLARRLHRLRYIGDVTIRHDLHWVRNRVKLGEDWARRMELGRQDSSVVYQTWNIRRFEADRLRQHMNPR